LIALGTALRSRATASLGAPRPAGA
jgi:hypothetical protein